MATICIGVCLRAIFHAVCFNGPLAFYVCSLFFTILNQNEFRIATIAMFTSDLNAGVVPQMSPPLHEQEQEQEQDLERLRTTMVDYLIGVAASCRGLCTGRVFRIEYNFISITTLNIYIH